MNIPNRGALFTATQHIAIHDWLSRSPGTTGERNTQWNRVAVAEVRQAMNLPLIPYHSFLGPDCWLAGGAVMRWFCRERAEEASSKGDFDFYFTSLEAMNITATAMVERGFQLHGYGNPPRNIREFLKRPVRDEKDSGIWNDVGKPAPITPELIKRLELGTLELLSPTGERIQLVALAFDATPLDDDHAL